MIQRRPEDGRKAGTKRKSGTHAARSADDIPGPDDGGGPEQALWVAVVTQAMMDGLSRSRKPEDQFAKFEAIRWLTGGSADFYDVCLLAGLDPDDVRVRAGRALSDNATWRAHPGTGKRYLQRKAYRERERLKARPVRSARRLCAVVYSLRQP